LKQTAVSSALKNILIVARSLFGFIVSLAGSEVLFVARV
jgi:hypothetical protein